MRFRKTTPDAGIWWAFFLAAGLVLCGPGIAESPPSEDGEREAALLTRVRRLTFEGLRAGEGYFSADGRKLVFQSEREPGNPFYQIYVLDFESGESFRVSPGTGKTTCAFFRPGGEEIVYASTHHDPRTAEYQREELELRAKGEQRRYAWDYDPQMEIYVHAPSTGTNTRLTDNIGYDAEASYDPRGQAIVFSSTRDAYNRKLSDEERSQLEVDPSYFAEIYLMRGDGTNQRRLTHTTGYDGGPFFSADGKKIIWRRFDEQGLIADIWSMNLDGSDQRQLTDFGSMSWAPYPHPSGKYIIFTSNKLGFENFELFIVDTDGRKEPVRVTYTPGFDGLPVPAPDGTRLAWTSKRQIKEGGGAQIFLARWNHEEALRLLAAAPARIPAPAEPHP